MRTRSPRTILTLSAAVALAAAAMAPTAAFAKGPGPGAGDCDADCTADQTQVQQQAGGSGQRTRARDESASGQQAATKANAGGGGQVQARDGSGDQVQARDGSGNQARQATTSTVQNAGRNSNRSTNQNAGLGQNAKEGAGNGPNEDGERGPGTCDECTAEMGDLDDEQLATLMEDLVFMANEEKLAHDVYAYFAGMYDLPIFGNIAESEARHQEAVNVVLERYGLDDTAIGLTAGEFSNDRIDDLYSQLIAQGSASLDAALEVGVTIEEIDIADLKDRLEGLEELAPDVYEMYSHLLAGSENHLAAFSARAS